MAFALLQSQGEGDPTFIWASPVTAGSLFVFGFRWEGATGSGNVSGSQSAGGGALTMLTRVDNAAGDHHAQIGYLLTNNGIRKLSIWSFPASNNFIEIAGAEFPYTDTPTIDTSNTGSGSGTPLASGAITLNATRRRLARRWAMARPIQDRRPFGPQHQRGGGRRISERCLACKLTVGNALLANPLHDWLLGRHGHLYVYDVRRLDL